MYGTLLLRTLQHVECTQYMATRTAILDVETSLNQWLEEIAKKEAPSSGRILPWPGLTEHPCPLAAGKQVQRGFPDQANKFPDRPI